MVPLRLITAGVVASLDTDAGACSPLPLPFAVSCPVPACPNATGDGRREPSPHRPMTVMSCRHSSVLNVSDPTATATNAVCESAAEVGAGRRASLACAFVHANAHDPGTHHTARLREIIEQWTTWSTHNKVGEATLHLKHNNAYVLASVLRARTRRFRAV